MSIQRTIEFKETGHAGYNYKTPHDTAAPDLKTSASQTPFLADRTNGRAYATVLRLSVICLSVTLCIVAKRCVLEQKLLLRAYRKSYMRNRLVPK